VVPDNHGNHHQIGTLPEHGGLAAGGDFRGALSGRGSRLARLDSARLLRAQHCSEQEE